MHIRIPHSVCERRKLLLCEVVFAYKMPNYERDLMLQLFSNETIMKIYKKLCINVINNVFVLTSNGEYKLSCCNDL